METSAKSTKLKQNEIRLNNTSGWLISSEKKKRKNIPKKNQSERETERERERESHRWEGKRLEDEGAKETKEKRDYTRGSARRWRLVKWGGWKKPEGSRGVCDVVFTTSFPRWLSIISLGDVEDTVAALVCGLPSFLPAFSHDPPSPPSNRRGHFLPRPPSSSFFFSLFLSSRANWKASDAETSSRYCFAATEK